MCEKVCGSLIKDILENSKKYNCKLILPEDVVVSKNLEGNGKNINLKELEEDDMILDIGIKTISSIKKVVDNSNTVLWNGPAGYFENPNFQNGTKQILEIISQRSKNNNLFSVAGGGETVAAINKFNK